MPLGYNLFVQGGSFGQPFNFLDDNPIIPGPPVVNEFDPLNGLSNIAGSLAAARTSDPDSATSGWFINSSDNSASFDSGPYTVFGQVTSGMNIIDQIPFLPNAPNLAGTAFESMPLFNSDLVTIFRVVEIPLMSGDYDLNGVVDGGDMTTWEQSFGNANNLSADSNSLGIVDGYDFLNWQRHFDPSAPAPAVASVQAIPEPSTLGLASLAALTSLRLLRRNRTSH